MDHLIPFLQDLFSYDDLTGVITYRKDRGRAKVGDVAGYIATNGYRIVKCKIEGHRYALLAHRLGWAIHYGKWPQENLDHRDDHRDHNWIKNLRELTQVRNIARSSRRVRNLPRGVVWAGHTNKTNPYMGQFRSGDVYQTAYFPSPEAAAGFYREKFKAFHGCYPEEV